MSLLLINQILNNSNNQNDEQFKYLRRFYHMDLLSQPQLKNDLYKLVYNTFPSNVNLQTYNENNTNLESNNDNLDIDNCESIYIKNSIEELYLILFRLPWLQYLIKECSKFRDEEIINNYSRNDLITNFIKVNAYENNDDNEIEIIKYLFIKWKQLFNENDYIRFKKKYNSFNITNFLQSLNINIIFNIMNNFNDMDKSIELIERIISGLTKLHQRLFMNSTPYYNFLIQNAYVYEFLPNHCLTSFHQFIKIPNEILLTCYLDHIVSVACSNLLTCPATIMLQIIDDLNKKSIQLNSIRTIYNNKKFQRLITVQFHTLNTCTPYEISTVIIKNKNNNKISKIAKCYLPLSLNIINDYQLHKTFKSEEDFNNQTIFHNIEFLILHRRSFSYTK